MTSQNQPLPLRVIQQALKQQARAQKDLASALLEDNLHGIRHALDSGASWQGLGASQLYVSKRGSMQPLAALFLCASPTTIRDLLSDLPAPFSSTRPSLKNSPVLAALETDNEEKIGLCKKKGWTLTEAETFYVLESLSHMTPRAVWEVIGETSIWAFASTQNQVSRPIMRRLEHFSSTMHWAHASAAYIDFPKDDNLYIACVSERLHRLLRMATQATEDEQKETLLFHARAFLQHLWDTRNKASHLANSTQAFFDVVRLCQTTRTPEVDPLLQNALCTFGKDRMPPHEALRCAKKSQVKYGMAYGLLHYADSYSNALPEEACASFFDPYDTLLTSVPYVVTSAAETKKVILSLPTWWHTGSLKNLKGAAAFTDLTRAPSASWTRDAPLPRKWTSWWRHWAINNKKSDTPWHMWQPEGITWENLATALSPLDVTPLYDVFMLRDAQGLLLLEALLLDATGALEEHNAHVPDGMHLSTEARKDCSFIFGYTQNFLTIPGRLNDAFLTLACVALHMSPTSLDAPLSLAVQNMFRSPESTPSHLKEWLLMALKCAAPLQKGGHYNNKGPINLEAFKSALYRHADYHSVKQVMEASPDNAPPDRPRLRL